jgi:hypothetical protein
MQPTDKFRSDLDAKLRRLDGQSERVRLEALRTFFDRGFPSVAEEVKASLYAAFLEAWRTDQGRAKEWLGSVGSILLMDYDGTPMSKDEWEEIRESVALGSDELDIDLLGYIMALVVDHGAM